MRLLLPLFLLLAAPLGLMASDGVPSPMTLFARAHVVVVHFPVALLMVLALIEVLRWRRKTGSMDQTIAIIAVITALSSIVAIIQGLMLADDGSGSVEHARLLALHKWLGIVTGVVAIGSAAIALRRQLGDTPGLAKLYRVFVLPGALLVSLTGHYGGQMVHGEKYLPIMPWEIWAFWFGPKVEAVPVGELPDKIDFYRDIDPIFKKNCYECHDAKKAKGDLRMDSREAQLKGGENGPSIIPGDSKKSLSMIRIRGEGDDEQMPKKKDPLNAHEMALIAKWIDQGAAWPAKP
ncbi:MAG TPA: c-type cytochrome domain-containing protein [Planctomycetota bacterium]|nr:c-type cytochrome domain-containing protein [Planctomycetota bacterium]